MLEGSVHGRCVLAYAERPDRVVAPLMQALIEADLTVRSLTYGTTSLEEVFLSFTDEHGVPE